MRSLFWRYFFTFWLAAAIVVGAAVSLVAGIAWQRVNSLDGLTAASLTRDAQLLGRNIDPHALRVWVRAVQERYSALRIYIVYRDGRDILGRVVPARVAAKLRGYREARDAGDVPQFAYQSVLPDSAAGQISWWDPQTITLQTGETLYMAFLPYDALQWERRSPWQFALLLGLVTLVLTAPLCWALSRGVTGPVRHLKHAARALADGRLDTRTPAALARRTDELGQLARDFDTMTARMQELVVSQENLLRNVAHELRSPLARLMLALELARRNNTSLDLQLDRIEREGLRLDVLIGHTLQLARLGAVAGPAETVDLTALVDQVVQDGRFEAHARGVAIAWQRPVALQMIGEPHSLTSAVENVLRNAIRHTDAAQPISVSLRQEGDQLVLDVIDSGPGVPEAELARIFEPFYRVRGGRAPGKPGGAGLGLSIVAASVRRHGGTLCARNRSAQGHLHVCLRLPRKGAAG